MKQHILIHITFIVVGGQHRLGQQRLVELRGQQQLVVVVRVQLVDEVVALEGAVLVDGEAGFVVVGRGRRVAGVRALDDALLDLPDGRHGGSMGFHGSKGPALSAGPRTLFLETRV